LLFEGRTVHLYKFMKRSLFISVLIITCQTVFPSVKFWNLKESRSVYVDTNDQLNSLDLSYNKAIRDISFLEDSTHLEFLNLSGTNIRDLSPLKKITSLKWLFLGACRYITDFSPLSELTSLQVLRLESTEIANCAFLSQLTSLEMLNLNNTKITDISSLGNLNSLQVLNLECCDIGDVSPLTNLTSLKRLSLVHNDQLVDISPLASLTLLEWLNLAGSKKIIDLSTLSHLTSLQWLCLGGCDITALPFLSHLKSLKKFSLSNNQKLKDITGLSGCKSIDFLELDNCRELSEIKVVSNLKFLKVLDITNCDNIADISPLSGLYTLSWLQLRSCEKIRDYSPLLSCLGKGDTLFVDVSDKSVPDSVTISYAIIIDSLNAIRTNCKEEEKAFFDDFFGNLIEEIYQQHSHHLDSVFVQYYSHIPDSIKVALEKKSVVINKR